MSQQLQSSRKSFFRLQLPSYFAVGIGVAFSFSAFATNEEPVQVDKNEVRKVIYKKLPSKLSSLSKSLLFDTSEGPAPFGPLISESVVETIVAKKSRSQQLIATQATLPQNSPVLRAPAATTVAQIEPQSETKAIPTAQILPAKPEREVVQTPAKVTAPAAKEEAEVVEKTPVVLEVTKPSSLFAKGASVLVLDEEAFARQEYFTVSNATVSWLHPDSSLKSKPNTKGIAKVPYPKTHSARFVVQAEGYLPAVGYAINGMITPVLLYKEDRLGPILKSLGLAPDARSSLLLGRFLNQDLAPVSNMVFDTLGDQRNDTFFSLGGVGLFHSAARKSGSQGDFLFKGLERSLQYLLSSKQNEDHSVNEWPAQMVDLQGLGPVLTSTLLESDAGKFRTQVVDAFTLIKPDTGIFANIGGQRGIFEPDEDGYLSLDEVYLRPNVDLVEVNAQGYMKTWMNVTPAQTPNDEILPLFTKEQVNSMLSPIRETVSREDTVAIGSVRPEDYKQAQLQVRVFDSNGKKAQSARIHYFAEDGRLSDQLDYLETVDGRFVITGLEDGEYHAVLVDPKSGQGQSIQVFRAAKGVVSSLMF